MSSTPASEAYRRVLEGCRTPDGDRASLIVTRQGSSHAGRVWVTFAGAVKTTAVLTDPQASELIKLVHDAAGTR